MPWKSFKIGAEYCVHRISPEGGKVGPSLGCHGTLEASNTQVAALNASVDEVKMTEFTNHEGVITSASTVEIKELEETNKKADHLDERIELDESSHDSPQSNPIPFGVTSFAELDELKRDNRLMQMGNQMIGMLKNIFNSPDIDNKVAAITAVNDELRNRLETQTTFGKDKKWQPLTDKLNKLINKQETKREGGIDYPSSDFAYVPDREAPSTWKLRLAEERPGNITVSQLGRAAAALSPGGFRGNRVQIPSADMAKVKNRIRSEYRKLGIKPEDIPTSVKESSFKIIKKENGELVWVATYSNKFRDDDNPSEIISEASHKLFNEKLKSGEFDYPELWLYHVPIVWGKATTHIYDNAGFSVAAGVIYPEYEWLADHLSKSGVELGVSHGMPVTSIKRDKENQSIITEHQTIEISPLPMVAAANKLTDFATITEVKMIAPTDKDKLGLLGLSNDQIATLESGNEAKSTEAVQNGVEYKEKTQPKQETKTSEYVTRDELNELTKLMVEHIKQLGEDLRKELSQVSEENDLKHLEMSPAATFRSLISSVVGKEETKLDGRTALAKQVAKDEAAQPAQSLNQGPTDIRFLNNLMNSGGTR